jgi:hypothetical protein
LIETGLRERPPETVGRGLRTGSTQPETLALKESTGIAVLLCPQEAKMNDIRVNTLTTTRFNERLSTLYEELDSMYRCDVLDELPDRLHFAVRCDLLVARDRIKLVMMMLGEATDG